MNWTEDSIGATTADRIAGHAKAVPDDIAVIDNGKRYSYAAFHRDIGRCQQGLEALGLAAGDTVAIEWTSLYPHWVLLLALEERGVVTFSYSREDLIPCRALLAEAELVIATESAMPGQCRRSLLLTPAWMDALFAAEPKTDVSRPASGADRPLRVHYGSGTTGQRKRMIKTVRTHEFRIWQFQQKMRFGRGSVYLVNHSFCLQGIYIFATACIREGGTCLYDGAHNILQTLSREAVTHASFLPGLLAQVVAAAPDGYAKRGSFVATTFGAGVSETLRTQTRDVLGAEVIESYSTNETGSICTVNPDGSGSVLPGMEVEVVDDADRPLLGQPGRVRVRSPGCIDGYVNDRPASERMFRNGWFYPGDIGILQAPGSLQLVGREDDLINIGGIKIDPADVEEQLHQVVAVADLCVTSVADSTGNDHVCIAVVPDPSTSLESIRESIAPRIPAMLGNALILQVNRIPRTGTGKARRKDLKAAIRRSLDPGASPITVT